MAMPLPLTLTTTMRRHQHDFGILLFYDSDAPLAARPADVEPRNRRRTPTLAGHGDAENGNVSFARLRDVSRYIDRDSSD